LRYQARVGQKTLTIELDDHRREGTGVIIEGQEVAVDLQKVTEPHLYSLLLDGRSYEVLVQPGPAGRYTLVIGDSLFWVEVLDERHARLAQLEQRSVHRSGEVIIKAPMPGVVRAVEVQVGDTVQGGQGLVILEAMKMENELRAPHAGTVRAVHVTQGDKVEMNQALVELQ